MKYIVTAPCTLTSIGAVQIGNKVSSDVALANATLITNGSLVETTEADETTEVDETAEVKETKKGK